jgi:hypothetical protein
MVAVGVIELTTPRASSDGLAARNGAQAKNAVIQCTDPDKRWPCKMHPFNVIDIASHLCRPARETFVIL